MEIQALKVLSILFIVLVVIVLIWVIGWKLTEGVDMVYSWIDGDNPIVVEQINYWRQKDGGLGSATSANRFKTMDELRYSLRSVKLYAPWIRNVYIITSHHIIPEWFDKEIGARHGIYFIDDSQLLPEVPVFNSLAKESVKHLIPGLRERYLYMNDDLFFGSSTTLSDFLFEDGKAKMFLEPDNFVSGDPPLDTSDYFSYGLHCTRRLLIIAIEEGIISLKRPHCLEEQKFLERSFDKMQLKKHTPDIHFVSEDKLKWKTFPEHFMRTAKGKFRQTDQIYDNTLFDNYWKLARDKARPSDISYAYLYIKGDLAAEEFVYDHIRRERPKVFCVNDGIVGEENKSVAMLKAFLEEYFPEPAPWEI